jgi:hypothetical protein
VNAPRPPPAAFVALGEEVLGVLRQHGIDALVIGGFALAAHRAERPTRDLDLGVDAKLSDLETVCHALRDSGHSTTLNYPDADDHLGGVLVVTNPVGARVEVVNYGGRFPAAIQDALAALPPIEGSQLRAIPLPYLIILKVYAGLGPKSKRDIAALLEANPEADIAEIRHLCAKHRLKGWQAVLPAPDGG